jgi:hypothetical protein
MLNLIVFLLDYNFYIIDPEVRHVSGAQTAYKLKTDLYLI